MMYRVTTVTTHEDHFFFEADNMDHAWGVADHSSASDMESMSMGRKCGARTGWSVERVEKHQSRYVGTIQPQHVGDTSLDIGGEIIRVVDFMGPIQTADVGKSIYESLGQYQIHPPH